MKMTIITMKKNTKKVIIVECGVWADRLIYFAQNHHILETADFRTFPSSYRMTKAQEDEYYDFCKKIDDEYVETVEPTLAYSIPISVLNKLYDTNIEIANWGRIVHQECLLSLQCVRIDNLTMTAKERYNVLLKRFPDICQRVNLGYIASFLGISISTLSRIRAEK